MLLGPVGPILLAGTTALAMHVPPTDVVDPPVCVLEHEV